MLIPTINLSQNVDGVRAGETFKKRDHRGGQKLLRPTVAVPINVGGARRSCSMAGQVRHLEKRDRRGSQKLLIPTTYESQNVNGVRVGETLKKAVAGEARNCSF
mgnify:FL=1